MPSLYLKMKFNLELFATDKDAKKVLSSSDDKTVGDITLHYISGPEITKKHGPGAYDIFICPDDFLKKSKVNLISDDKVFLDIEGVAKIDPKADLYQYLMEDKNPVFQFRSTSIRPVAFLYASKKENDVDIDCICSKNKPSI